MEKNGRREFLRLCAAAAFGLCTGGAALARPAAIDVAVYAEYSPTSKKMQPGWNTRVFNRTELQQGDRIRLVKNTGVVTLAPGFYHITGSSLVTYGGYAPDPGKLNPDPHPYAGYCRLRYAKDVNVPNEKAIAIGTISNANMVPSLIDTYLTVKQKADILIEHQVGDHTDGIYLESNENKSAWHVFARIAIRRE